MYKRIPAIILNSIFGLCLAYDVIVAGLAGALGNKTSIKSLTVFYIFNIVWVLLFFSYNVKRYKVTKDGKMYWITLFAAFLPWSVVVALLFCLEK